MTHEPTLVSVDSQRFQSVKERHRAFWARSEQNSFLRSLGLFAPSTPLALRQADGRVITHAERLLPDMIDVDALIDEVEAWDISKMDSSLPAQGQYLVTVGLGDLMPACRPLVKIPWIEAMLGCPITMTEGHIWNEHYPGDPEEVIRRGANFEHNPWFQLYLEFLKKLQARLGKRFPVSANTLFRGASDLAAAVMGVQEACMGWIDQPAFMARLMRVCTDANLTLIEAGYKVLQPFQGGYMSGYGIWSPAPIVHTQADHSTLLSAKMYQQQILPYDREIMRACPISDIHLHNCGLHVAPLLVELPELTAIEVAVDPYPLPERKPYEMKMLKLIQEHKPLILDVNFPSWEEAESVLAELSPRGLCFNARFEPKVFETLPAGLPGSDVWLLSA